MKRLMQMLTNLWRRFDGIMPEPEATVWASARDHVQLGYLGAEWLEGHLRCQPGYNMGQPCRPDPETEELIPTLVALNRAGFVTDNSQPGIDGDSCSHGDVWRQRAFVDGWCTEATARALLALFAEDDKVLVEAIPVCDMTSWKRLLCCDYHGPLGPVFNRAAERGHALALTQARRPHSEAGESDWDTGTARRGSMSRDMLYLRWDGVDEEMFKQLARGWFVFVADTEWGNNDRIWPALRQFAETTLVQRRKLGGNGEIIWLKSEAEFLHDEGA